MAKAGEAWGAGRDRAVHRKPLFKNKPGKREQFRGNRAVRLWVLGQLEGREEPCRRMDLPGKGAVGRASWG